MYQFSNRSKSNLIGVHPEIAFMTTEAIKITKMDFMVFEGVRSQKRQNYLYSIGASKTLNHSYHLWGLALDLVPTPAENGHKLTWEEELFPPIVKAVKEVIKAHGLDVKWGYDLWKWDLAHWQMLPAYKGRWDIRELNKSKVCG